MLDFLFGSSWCLLLLLFRSSLSKFPQALTMEKTMKKNILVIIGLLGLLGALSSCRSQDHSIDRQPAVAGQFYPAETEVLRKTLAELFLKAVPPGKTKNILAIISPHAGYVFSGVVAASSFNQIDAEKEYENIFVLGPSHHVAFGGAAIYAKGNYITPLGTVDVNRELARKLIKGSKVFVERDDAHALEHSVEVQLPFLQYIMKKKFTIVPIVVGTGGMETCEKIARELQPYFNSRNLFIISTDFSHYPSYADAQKVDKSTADAICLNSLPALLDTLRHTEDLHIPNLATSMCGWSCVLTLLAMTRDDPGVSYSEILYKNSGDVPDGRRDEVVGYHAIAVSSNTVEPAEGFILTEEEKTELLSIVRKTLVRYLEKHETPAVELSSVSPVLTTKCGAFVTLKEHGILRGCIGRFDANEPLCRVVQSMAIASATQDPRFPPVESPELSSLEIEISVLTPMRKIESIDEIELGRHGIYIRKGSHSGTFLPQVASETGWSKEEFLGHCAQDKAGIGWDGWKDAEIFVYEALVFGEHEAVRK